MYSEKPFMLNVNVWQLKEDKVDEESEEAKKSRQMILKLDKVCNYYICQWLVVTRILCDDAIVALFIAIVAQLDIK